MVPAIQEETQENSEIFLLLGLEFCAFISFRSIRLVLIGPVVHECAHFELFINFSAICLDFVVLARITQTNNSKAYLEAQ